MDMIKNKNENFWIKYPPLFTHTTQTLGCLHPQKVVLWVGDKVINLGLNQESNDYIYDPNLPLQRDYKSLLGQSEITGLLKLIFINLR